MAPVAYPQRWNTLHDTIASVQGAGSVQRGDRRGRRRGDPPYIEHDARVSLNLHLSTFVRSVAMFPVGTPVPTAAIGAYWRTRHDIEGRSIMLLPALARALGTVIEMLEANGSTMPALRPAG